MRSLFQLTCLLIVAAVATSVKMPKLNSEAREFYEQAKENIRLSFPPDQQLQSVAGHDYYSHLFSDQRHTPSQAEMFANRYPHGPTDVMYGNRGRYAYVTTRIPWNSQLGQTWGLHTTVMDDSGNRMVKDLYAFWRVNRADRSKLDGPSSA